MRKYYFLIIFLLLTAATVQAADITWTDVSKRFVQNTDFNSGNSDGDI